jgi:hypothetical protein
MHGEDFSSKSDEKYGYIIGTVVATLMKRE